MKSGVEALQVAFQQAKEEALNERMENLGAGGLVA